MAKQSQESTRFNERLRRTYRIIRYLYRQGSLFRKPAKYDVPKKRERKDRPASWLTITYRKLRYLYHTGSLFKKRKRPARSFLESKGLTKRVPAKRTFSIHRVYRRIRYLWWRGSLFSRRYDKNLHPPPKQETLSSRKKAQLSFYSIYRKIRYLHTTGALYRPRPRKIQVTTSSDSESKKHTSSFGSNPYVIYRKLRYLHHRGSLFTVKGTIFDLKEWAADFKDFIRTIRKQSYSSYRKLRYITSTGRIFKIKKRPQIISDKNRRTLRRLRYLTYTGAIFKIPITRQSAKYFWDKNLRYIAEWDHLQIIFNSTALFILAHLVIFILTSFGSSLMATTFNIESIIYSFKIEYLIRSVDWRGDAIVNVFSVGPFLALVVAIIALIIYSFIIYQRWLFNLFLIWMFAHGIVHFLGEVSIGLILSKGLGFAIRWAYFSDSDQLLFIYSSVLLLFVVGLLVTRLFMMTGNVYFTEINSMNRTGFIMSQFIVPFVLGTLILTVTQIPRINWFDFFVNMTMFFVVVSVAVRGHIINTVYFDESERKIKASWWLVGIVLFLIIVSQIIFRMGVRID